MRRNGELHPGQLLDDMLARKWAEANAEGLQVIITEENEEKSRDTADYARFVADHGNWRPDDIPVPEETNYIQHGGTYFVPLDFNRFISVRDTKREDVNEENKIELQIMVGESGPQVKTLAVFHENDTVELKDYKKPAREDLLVIESLLRFIHNSSDK